MSRNKMYRGNPIGISSQELADIESAINSLKSNGLDNLNGAIQSTTDMFSAFGVELGATPKRLLSVGTATIKMISSISKLKDLKIKGRIIESFTQSWQTAGTQMDTFGTSIKELPKQFKDLKAAIATKGGVKAALIGKTGLLTVAKASLKKTMSGVFAMLHPKKIGWLLLKGVKLAFKGVLFALNVVKGIFVALWKMSPLGKIVAAIGLVVAGMVGLISWLNRGTDAGKEFEAQNERSREAMDALNDSIENNRRAHEANVRSAEVSHRVNNDLIQGLKDLNTEYELSAGERARVRNEVEQLNGSIEGLNLEAMLSDCHDLLYELATFL